MYTYLMQLWSNFDNFMDCVFEDKDNGTLLLDA